MLRIAVRITFEQPLHIGAGNRDNPSALVRDPQGRPCIPAATLKGVHRVATEQIATALGLQICRPPLASQMCQPTGGLACPICRIFGAHWLPGAIRYADLLPGSAVTPQIEQVAHAPHSRRRRVMLKADTSAREVVRAGSIFAGRIDLLTHDADLLALTVAGLRAVNTIGAAGATGHGACRVEAEVTDLIAGRTINNAELAASLQKLKMGP